jgi:hypothetical protein
MAQITEHPTARLLVEGHDDFHVVHNLFQHYNIDVRNLKNSTGGQFDVKDCKGISELLKFIPTQIKNVDILGVIIDADNDENANWTSVRDKFNRAGYNLPEKLDSNGCICESNGKKIGVWMMPNNSDKGMLEDFIKLLIGENDTLLPKVEKIIREIETENLQKYKGTYRPKALIHTWLAWQETPGTPMGAAITRKYLSLENKELCDRFIDWVKTLFIE